MDAREQDRRRRAVATGVALALRRRDFRTTLQLVDTEGQHPFIAVLPEDPMSTVFGELADLGGNAYVVTEGAERLEFVRVIRSTRVDLATLSPDEPCPIHGDTTVGMVFAYLKLVRRPVVCHEVRPQDVRLELVESGTDLQVPVGM